MSSLSWNILHDLEHTYGDSFYLLDIAAFTSNYQRLLHAFRRHYPHTNIGYSYKTNYIPHLCQEVQRLGGYAEVVSDMEYDLARQLGVPPHAIIVNGPYKPPHFLERVLLEGALVHIDSPYEVELVTALAAAYPTHSLRLGLRCNFAEGSDRPSRFGLSVENGDLARACAQLRAYPNCHVLGLHTHVTTAGRRSALYAERTARILEIVRELFQAAPPRFIDIGGGFFGPLSPELRAQIGGPIPSFDDYAAAIAPQIAAAFPGPDQPELLLEPGIALTGDSMRFAARVWDIKTVQGRTVALTSGCVYNIKPTLHSLNQPMQIYRQPSSTPALPSSASSVPTAPIQLPAIDLVGYTCLEHDCLYQGLTEPIAPGDYVVFEHVGAYTVVMKPPFIRPAPAIVCYDEASGRATTIRRPETCADVFASFAFPVDTHDRACPAGEIDAAERITLSHADEPVQVTTRNS